MMGLDRREPIKAGYHPVKFDGYRHCGSGDIVISLCYGPRDQRVIRPYRQEPIKVIYHHAKFTGHRQCGSGDMILVCLVILQEQVIKGSCDFMGTSPSM